MEYFPECEKEYQAIRRHNVWAEKVAEIYEALIVQYQEEAYKEAERMATEMLGYDGSVI